MHCDASRSAPASTRTGRSRSGLPSWQRSRTCSSSAVTMSTPARRPGPATGWIRPMRNWLPTRVSPGCAPRSRIWPPGTTMITASTTAAPGLPASKPHSTRSSPSGAQPPTMPGMPGRACTMRSGWVHPGDGSRSSCWMAGHSARHCGPPTARWRRGANVICPTRTRPRRCSVMRNGPGWRHSGCCRQTCAWSCPACRFWPRAMAGNAGATCPVSASACWTWPGTTGPAGWCSSRVTGMSAASTATMRPAGNLCTKSPPAA